MSSTTQQPDSGPRVTRDQMRDLSTLRRATDGRMVAGVAEGLSRHFDVDPLLIRVVLGTLTLFGGAGIALYVIAWICIPEEGQRESALSRVLRRDTTRVMTAGLVVAGVIALAAMVGAIGFSAPNPVGLVIVAGLAIGGFAMFSRRSERRAERRAARATNPYPPPVVSPIGVADAGTGSVMRSADLDSAEGGATAQGEAGDATGSAAFGAPTTATLPPTAPSRPFWRRPESEPRPGGPDSGLPPPMPGSAFPPPPPPAKPPRSHLFAVTMAVIAIAIGIEWIIDQTTTAAVPGSVYPGTVLGVTALGLIAGTWYGRSRSLILVGVLATMATAIATVVGSGSIGAVSYRPADAAAVRSDYNLGAGQLVLHLERVTDLDALGGRTVHVDASFGQVQLIVPSTLPIRINAHVDHGDIVGPSSTSISKLSQGGEAVTVSATAQAVTTSPVLTVDLNVHFGEVVVTRYDCPGPASVFDTPPTDDLSDRRRRCFSDMPVMPSRSCSARSSPDSPLSGCWTSPT